MSPALAGGFLTTAPPGKSVLMVIDITLWGDLGVPIMLAMAQLTAI